MLKIVSSCYQIICVCLPESFLPIRMVELLQHLLQDLVLKLPDLHELLDRKVFVQLVIQLLITGLVIDRPYFFDFRFFDFLFHNYDELQSYAEQRCKDSPD